MFFSAHKKSSPIVGFFRLILTILMFVLMSGGLYAAFQGFSGVDPLSINPKAFVSAILASKDPQQIIRAILDLDLSKSLNKQEIFTGSFAPETSAKQIRFSFVLVSDSHSENNYLQKALLQAKSLTPQPAFIIGLGDYTEVGTINELKQAKAEFDQIGIRYFVIPGDHDLWDGRDKTADPLQNFTQVFGSDYQVFSYQGVKFILINNADNYTGIDQKQSDWIDSQLSVGGQDKVKLMLAFVHEGLYHPSSDHYMGRVTESLKKQAKNLTLTLKSGGVNEVFSGDIHFFSRYTEPQLGLNMTTIGAVASARNTQAPRFALVNIYDDFEFDVKDIEIH